MTPVELNLPVKTIQPKYSFLQSLGIPLDMLMLGSWVALTLLYALTIGRKRGPILLLSTYAGLAATSVISDLDLPPLQSWQNGEFFGLGIFIFVTVIAFVALIRAISRYIRIHHSQQGVVLLAAFETGAFLSSLGLLVPAQMQKQLTGFSSFLFVTPWTHALWLLVPLLILVIGEYGHRRRSSSSRED